MTYPKTKLDSEIKNQKRRGILAVISGPSAGVGKDAIVKGLRKKYGYAKITTFTSRARRPGEKEGFDYHFVTRQDFEEKAKQGFFLEWEKYLGDFYGTPKKEVLAKMNYHGQSPWYPQASPSASSFLSASSTGKTRGIRGSKIKKGSDVLLRVDVRGAKSVKKVIPEAILFYIAPPSFEILKRRLKRRKDAPEMIAKKLQVAHWEVEQFEGFDYLVVNEEGKLDQTVETVRMIIEAERRRVRVAT